MNSGVMANTYMSASSMGQMNQSYNYPQGDVGNQAGGIQAKCNQFWNQISSEIGQDKSFGEKHHDLPLARIKKIMKSDESMIGSEAPVIVAKACEIFVRELTMRAWSHTEDNKRRTLQKIDITTAVSKCDMYDFLIDIVPREDGQGDFTAATDSKVVPYETMFYYYPPNQSTGMVDSQINSIQGIPTMNQYMPSAQASAYNQNISQNIAQGIGSVMNPTIVQSQQRGFNQPVQPVGQGLNNGANYMYMDGIQQNGVVSSNANQGAVMMNHQMMGQSNLDMDVF